MCISHASQRYRIGLGKGLIWQIDATSEAAYVTRTVSEVMGLREDFSLDGIPITFCRCDPEELSPIPNLNAYNGQSYPETGWKCHFLMTWRMWTHDEVPDVVLGVPSTDFDPERLYRFWQIHTPIQTEIIKKHGIPFHGGLIKWQEKGVIISGISGAGKSTCCSRFPAPWSPLSDEETVLIPTADGRFEAHPFPTWSVFRRDRQDQCQLCAPKGEGGRNPVWNIEEHIPLTAIFFIQQAETDEVLLLEPPTNLLWVSKMTQQMGERSWFFLEPTAQAAIKKQLFVNSLQLMRNTPCFLMDVSLNGRFWEHMERTLSNLH